MKKLFIAASLVALATPVLASKARLGALGQDGRASFFIDDTRSVFLNPAKLNNMSNYVVSEWGDANDATDSDTAPHAEGGFFNKGRSLSYGLYVGNEYASNNDEREANTSAGNFANFQGKDNALDIFVAGDMGMKWGARVQYSGNKQEADSVETIEQSGLELGLGIITGKVEAYANLELKDESTATTGAADDKWEADLGINVGAAYDYKHMTFYVDLDKSGAEVTRNDVLTTSETTQISVGVAKTYKVAKGSTVFTDLRFVNISEEEKVGDADATETKTKKLPLTIGFETQANSWLALRASIKQNVFIGESEDNDGKKSSLDNSTTVAAGATLTWGKLNVDGLIGTTGGDRDASNGESEGVLATDNLMTRVGVTYSF